MLGGTEVLVLGAGFSRAVSKVFPTTDELGLAATKLAVVAEEELPSGGFHGGSFETWLSGLVDEQPYLSEAEHHLRLATFYKVSDAIEEVLRGKEHEAYESGFPQWLFELVGIAHHHHLDVVTLNYDVLVEAALVANPIMEPTAGGVSGIGSYQVRGRLPSQFIGGVPGSSFHLLKLHGSIDWLWSPGDPTGATLDEIVVAHHLGPRTADEIAQQRQEKAGRVPFVVPPVWTKTDRLRIPVIRVLWQLVYRSLGAAERITLVGYPLPAGDLAMASMVVSSICGREVAIEIATLIPKNLRHAFALSERMT